MMFFGMLFFIYCVVGAGVGIVCWGQEKWPAKKMIEDTVAGLGSYLTIDISKSALFAILCGPAFWIIGMFFIIFRFVISLLGTEE